MKTFIDIARQVLEMGTFPTTARICIEIELEKALEETNQLQDNFVLDCY
jgi:hypothetical protein